ncbi:MAG TPA: LuxR C-terminal-related transcriptional regulator [Thermomicrobiales bacterium]|nr:LuxR C-terminal-related transcriptional regulator [Thermomicrobiales bacterium]
MADPTPGNRVHLRPLSLIPPPHQDQFAVSDVVPLTTFIGRDQEVATVTGLLNRPDVRLLSLTGPGGIGKTRLALQVSDHVGNQFAEDIAVVSLATVRNPDLVPQEIAETLHVQGTEDHYLERIKAFLGERQLLLVLDNLEHVLDSAAALVASLLTTCPGLTVLATSRTRLGISGEQVVPVAPLDQEAARTLFEMRAESADPTFAVTAQSVPIIDAICDRLDRLPLAIELAAARVTVLPPPALLARLDQGFDLLSGGPRNAPLRQRDMRATVAWSYNLLPAAEQVLFRRLGVFVGGFTLDAAATVANDGHDVLAGVSALLDASLVQRIDYAEGEPRFTMLETIREYALEQLVTHGEEHVSRDLHARYYLSMAERLRRQIEGPKGPAVLASFELEHPNLRVALATASSQANAELAVRLTAALWKFWYVRRHIAEGRSWLDAALALAGETPPGKRAEVLYAAGSFAVDQGDYAQGEIRSQECLALAQSTADREQAGLALFLRGQATRWQGRVSDATAAFDRALAIIGNEPSTEHLRSTLLTNYGEIAYELGHVAQARAHHEEALAIWRRRGDPWGVANALLSLATVTSRTDPSGAAAFIREALAHYRDVGDGGGVASSLATLAMVTVGVGQVEGGVRLFGAAESITAKTSVAKANEIPAGMVRAVDNARLRLGTSRFRAAWTAGTLLTPDEAFTEAMALNLSVPPSRQTPSPFGLSARELEVLRLMDNGRTDQQIADTLSISYRTVTTHVTRILNKLGVDSRTAAVGLAVRERVI